MSDRTHRLTKLALTGTFLLGSFPQARAIDFLDELPSRHRLNGSATVDAFGDAGGVAEQSTVVLIHDEIAVALAAAVDEQGHLVTKASEIEGMAEGDLLAATPDGSEVAVKRIAIDPATDIALLKIEPGKTDPVSWGDSGALEQGSWVAAMGADAAQLMIGVISATRRQIERRPGVLGVNLDTNDDPDELGVAIDAFGPNSPAQKEGLLEGDLIVRVEDTEIKSRKHLAEEIRKFDPLDPVRIKVLRGEEGIPYVVTLNYMSNVFDMLDRNQRMSGRTSKRKAGFSDALQHEIPLSPKAMGGPLVNLDGTTVGINIARADRVTTFALPAELVKEVVERLLAGAAERVN